MSEKRKNRLIVPLLFWAVLTAITLSCNEPTTRSYMQIESIEPPSTSIDQPITVTVSVYGNRPGGGTGTVTVDGDTRCSFLLVNGRGSCRVSFHTAGEHTLAINYSGDANYASEYVRRPYTVVAPLTPTPSIRTELILQAAAEASAPGEDADFNVLVSPSEGIPPTGTVTLSSEGGSGCTASLSNGQGHCAMRFDSPGEWAVTATYPLTAQWLGSTATITHLVNYPTQITLSLTPDSPTAGQAVRVDVVVSVIGGGPAPTGDVSVTYGSEGCEDITLVEGRGSCSLTFRSTGTVTLEALYVPTDVIGNTTEEIFRISRTTLDLTVRAAAAPPPPEPTQDTSGVGGTGCMVPDGQGGFYCQVPCSDPATYFQTCP